VHGKNLWNVAFPIASEISSNTIIALALSTSPFYVWAPRARRQWLLEMRIPIEAEAKPCHK
jgi:hypothetical protein